MLWLFLMKKKVVFKWNIVIVYLIRCWLFITGTGIFAQDSPSNSKIYLFKYRILTPGLPGNVLIRYILKGLFWVLFWEKPGREHALKQGSQEVMAIIQMRDGSDLDSGGTNGKGVKKRSGSWNILKAECKFSALNNWNDRKNAGRF